MLRSTLLRGVSAGSLALTLASSSTFAQEMLPEISIGAAAPAPIERVEAPKLAPPGFSKEKLALPVYREPTGQTFTSINAKTFKDTPLFTIADMLEYSPGMSFKQGNGPRDIVISIRGSGARVGGAQRNIILMEDGFSLTQPDGFSRTDSTDPHAYAAVDVYRGPSSALFGNWANGGAINFRTFTGAEIDGVRTGHEFGSFGYLNNYTLIGKQSGPLDIFLFASDVRSDGYVLHGQYDTQTVNLKATYSPSATDRFVFKWVHNELYGNLPTRLSLNQFYLNPFQNGCYSAPSSAMTLFKNLCGVTTVFLNGVAGPTASVTAQQSGWHRNDRRDVIGLRWEHDFDAYTTMRTQVIYDDKNFNQPVDTPVGVADVPSVNASSDITNHGTFQGHDVTHYFGLWYNHSRFKADTANLLGVGNGALGAITNVQEVMHSNMGARAREEIALAPDVTGVLGLGIELSKIAALSSSVDYGANTFTQIPANRAYWNFAPEAAIVYRPNSEWQIHARASSGYGTPYYGWLFVNQQGRDGSNTDLKSQRNTGFDAGLDWTPNETLKLSVTGFHEWYQNELLTQTPGAGLKNYTYNAPGSVHRGVEFLADWRPMEGWKLLANYTYNNQMFTDFVEQRGPVSRFDRAGYKIPGVAPHELTARVAYDQPSGNLKGFGSFVEYVYKSSYYMDNGNQLTAPSYGIVNANIHYDANIADSYLKNLTVFFEVRNIFDRNYISSANVISNSVNSFGFQNPGIYLAQTATGSIYAGAPRAFQGGLKFKF
jgi:iron complex outermembrane receptor protein